jgi:hypothetical protein
MQGYFFNDANNNLIVYMNKISHYLDGILETTCTIAIVTWKKIAAEKGFS